MSDSCIPSASRRYGLSATSPSSDENSRIPAYTAFPFFWLTSWNISGWGSCWNVSWYCDRSRRASATEYGLDGSNAVNVWEVEGPVLVEAASSCSRADCGSRILSPRKLLLVAYEGFETRNCADQLRAIG